MPLSGFATLTDHPIASAGVEAGSGLAGPERTIGSAGADLRLAQLMCARVCHDLIGAAGAIESGIELLDEEPGDTADIHDLIGLSGRQLNRRLAFYRLAFGFAGAAGAGTAVAATETGSLAEGRRATAGFVENSRVALHWRAKDVPCCQIAVLRMLLCAILTAAEALFRGGDLHVAVAGGRDSQRFTVQAVGRGARMAEPIVEALAPDASLDAVTARTVHAYYLGRLIERHAARLDIARTADGFSLTLTVPQVGA